MWFADKITQRRRRNLDKALDEFLRTASHVERDGDILTWHGRPVFARQPGDGISRKVAEIPLTERKVALIGLIGESPGINEAELTTLTARFFGWNRRGPEIARALSQDLRELQEQGRVQGVPERITLVEDGIGPGAHI